tara:strand:+ start:277 stop:993 length:717 start_codon:yes stop_codon:yes gene_type:complete
MKPVILMTGHTMPELAARRGDFDLWYAQLAGWSPDRFHVVDAVGGEPLPNPHNVDALIVSGSAHSVADYAAWSVASGQFMTEVVNAGIPTLGICYGHQLIGDCLGGRVGVNPAGREIGISVITQRGDDPIFDGLPTNFPVIQTHVDAVLDAPGAAEIIASNDNTEIQAMAIGKRTRTVQWHPEFDIDIIGHYITVRAEAIESEFGPGHASKLLKALQPVETGRVIMRNFLNNFAAGKV